MESEETRTSKPIATIHKIQKQKQSKHQNNVEFRLISITTELTYRNVGNIVHKRYKWTGDHR
jgi:hypothetical protein